MREVNPLEDFNPFRQIIPEARMNGIISIAADYTLGSYKIDEAYGYLVLVTAAATIQLLPGIIGMNSCIMSTAANLISVKPSPGDHFVLNGTALTAGNKVSSSSLAGDTLYFVCGAANTIYILPGINVNWVDGGA